MKTFLLVSLFLGSLAFANNQDPKDCDFHLKKEKLCATLIWVKAPISKEMPTAKDAASFDLQFWKAKKDSSKQNTALKETQKFALSLYMPAMSHGSQPMQITKDPTQPGLYHITQVLFSMSGKWEFHLKLKENNKEIDNTKMAYTLK